MKLSSREKVLLYILAFMVINLFGIMYLIQPTIMAYQSNKQAYEIAKSQYQLEEQYVAHKSEYLQALENAQQETKELEKNFYQFQNTEQLDQYIDELLGSKVKKYSASFTMNPSLMEGGSYQVEINCADSYQTLLDVIDTIQNQPSNICIQQMNLTKSDEGAHLWAIITLY